MSTQPTIMRAPFDHSHHGLALVKGGRSVFGLWNQPLQSAILSEDRPRSGEPILITSYDYGIFAGSCLAG